MLAIVIADLERTRLGLPSMLARPLAGRSVLARTLDRIGRVPGVERIVVLHPAGQEVAALIGAGEDRRRPGGRRLCTEAAALTDDYRAMRIAARAWSLGAWRGGLGGATCYDELLPAAPILTAMRTHGADTALLVGGDWCLIDPALCRRLIDLHLTSPDAMQLVFDQAPPGLSGVVVGSKMLEQLAQNPSAMFGHVLGYVPSRPQADPIGRDVCVQVSPAVRSCARRFIYDTPRSAALLDAAAERLGGDLDDADAGQIVAAAEAVAPAADAAALPQQVTVELTPRRAVNGPLTPQHYVALDRPDMSPQRVERLLRDAAAAGDVAVTFGGLGDALLHPQWDRAAIAAREAGALAVCVETDLLVERGALARLIELPIDVLSVRLNADRAATYAKVMGSDGFARAIENLQWLFSARHQRAEAGHGRRGLPWIVPRMVKTADTLEDLEGFFDKWVHHLGHAVIEPATAGCGLMPALSPVSMAPPRRRPCRQVARRMTVLSDGRVARCDQDWLGRAAAADESDGLATAAAALGAVRREHEAGRWDELCAACNEWHRP